jgi:chromosome partitioning protein
MHGCVSAGLPDLPAGLATARFARPINWDFTIKPDSGTAVNTRVRDSAVGGRAELSRRSLRVDCIAGKTGTERAMRVLAFASQKCGAGKTTLAGHIAVQAQRAGTKSVVLVDLDPDASLTDWFSLREEDDDPFPVARSSLKDLAAKLQQLRSDGVDLVVIDTPPTLHQAIDESIIAADLVAIPTRPCAHDLAAAGATVELVQSHGKPFCFVVNGIEPGGELTPEVVMALAQHGSIATVSIPRSVAMLETMVDGRTVMELPDNPAPASELVRLWDYLAKRLMKSGLVAADGDAPASAPPTFEIKTFEAAVSAAAKPSGDEEEEDEEEPAAAAPLKMATPKPEAATPVPEPAVIPPTASAPAAAPAPPANGGPSPEALRRYPRFKYEQPAILMVGDGQVDCVVHDISAGGALIAVSRTLKVGETVILALDSIGKLPAEIRHSDGGRAGLRFIIDPKQQLFLVKHLSAVIAAASTTVATADAHAAAS